MSARGKELWIIGTGGHARVVLDLARACGFAVSGFIEPRPGPDGPRFAWGLPVLAGLTALRDLGAPLVAVAIGDNRLRRETTAEAVSLGARPATLVHPSAFREASASIGDGAQVCLGAILGADAAIGPGALINSGAIVEHECRVGAFAHICPGVRLAGRVVVGDGAQVGIGATVIQNIAIGAHAVVGAGAVVLEAVAAGTTVVGVPARPLKA